jgi:GAF domain-containing protein/methyl-accepting chemotaxis protein
MNNIQKFFNTPLTELEMQAIPQNQRALYNVLLGAITYIPLLLIFNALGFFTIYVLTLLDLLDAPDIKLLGVGAVSLIAAILHIPIATFLKKNQIDRVLLGLYLVDGAASVVQLFLWQGTVPLYFFTAIAISPALVFLPLPGIKTRTRLIIIGMAVFFGLSTFSLEASLTYPRLLSTNLSGMAGLTVYITVMSVMITLVIANAINFRTIAARMIVTFASVVLISAASTLTISGLVNLFRDREKTFEQLQVISELKSGQMLTTLEGFERTAGQSFLNDELARQRTLSFLLPEEDTAVYDISLEFFNDAVRTNLRQSPDFQEIYIFDNSGKIALSSAQQNVGKVIAGEEQFVAAIKGQKYVFINDPDTQTEKRQAIIILTRIEQDGQFKGALAARVTSASIREIFEKQTSPDTSLETYLVVNDLSAFTQTRAGQATLIDTLAANATFVQKQISGQDIYPNYAGQDVLGHYEYLPDLDVMVVSEIAQSEVSEKVLQILFTNISIGMITALMTLSVVLIISRSISAPIVNLVEKASALAQGNLSARINIVQNDEIGTLAKTFNSLGDELQTLIQTLEQKVADRTDDLQKQANRLRVAAEVARDATTSQNLDELLTRSAQLVMDRFGFYHTGVFLIDPQREYAVLRASPTQAGQEMLQREHRLKIGQVGIVGYAAATGQPRIALDTDQDAVYFNNPLLPNTRSEMGLPLMVNNEIIGVLDVQSEQAEAFSQEDIAALQIMADQLALAIQRTQISDELQRNLQELEFAYQRFTLASWQELADEDEKRVGYKYDGLQIVPLTAPSKESLQAIRKKQTVLKNTPGTQGNNPKTTLAIPVRVREQVIGAINLDFSSQEVTQDTLQLVEEISNRLAMSLENARLYSETQKTAEKERLAGDISSQIGSSINVETILKTAVQEISRFTPGAEIMISLNKKDE